MTRDEFDDWFEYHSACFPGVQTWLGKLTDRDQAGVLSAWFRALRLCDLVDAKAASDHLFRSAEGGPRVYERHPSAVRDLAFDLKRARQAPPDPIFVDGEQAYRCLPCRDDGRRRVWHPKTVKAIAAGEDPADVPIYRAVVACDCEAGASWATMLPRFRSDAFVAYYPRPTVREERRDLIEGAAGIA